MHRYILHLRLCQIHCPIPFIEFKIVIKYNFQTIKVIFYHTEKWKVSKSGPVWILQQVLQLLNIFYFNMYTYITWSIILFKWLSFKSLSFILSRIEKILVTYITNILKLYLYIINLKTIDEITVCHFWSGSLHNSPFFPGRHRYIL